MFRLRRRACFPTLPLLALTVASLGVSAPAGAQDADPRPLTADTALKLPNTIAGEFTPGTGFTLIKTTHGSMNISVYGLFRYIDQVPANQTFTDHLGNVQFVGARNDLNWHRTFAWVSGFFYNPRFRYNVSLWSLPTTQQTLLFGNAQYIVSDKLILGVGVAPSTTARSMMGSWPYWAGSDRLMVEEFFRGGFSSGFFATGEVLPRLFYTLTVNNNISELGVVQANDTRNMLFGGTLRWQPTTGEFGPRNGFGDLEYHHRLATQFGISGAQSREGRYAPIGQAPNATQIKLSDGDNVFAEGALADSVTVSTLSYREFAMDAGAKYKGFSFQSEYYWRVLNDFVANGPLPLNSIFDRGFMAEASYMVVPKALNLYVAGGSVHDQFRRFPWEFGGGASYYPGQSRAWRINLHIMHVDRSPSSSFFGYYLAGLTGTVISIGSDFLL